MQSFFRCKKCMSREGKFRIYFARYSSRPWHSVYTDTAAVSKWKQMTNIRELRMSPVHVESAHTLPVEVRCYSTSAHAHVLPAARIRSGLLALQKVAPLTADTRCRFDTRCSACRSFHFMFRRRAHVSPMYFHVLLLVFLLGRWPI